MEKTNNNIPTAEELAIYIKEATVSVTNTYEQSPVVLMVDNSIIGTLGNFSAPSVKPKARRLSMFQPLPLPHWPMAQYPLPFIVPGK